jgi:hypothetical protein
MALPAVDAGRTIAGAGADHGRQGVRDGGSLVRGTKGLSVLLVE